MNKIWKKIIGICFCVVLCMIMAIAPIGDNFNVKFPIGQSSKVAKAATFNDFINDARWRNGTWWGSGKRPELSGWPCSECMAYAADFTKYMYGIDNPKDGEAFYNINDVRAGDVINVPGHWFVVLERNGNSLYTAEGNVSGQVWVRDGRYTIVGDKFQYKSSATSWSTYSLSVGYHYGTPQPPIFYESVKVSDVKETSASIEGWIDNAKANNLSSIGFRIGENTNNMKDIVITRNVNWTRAFLPYKVGDYVSLKPNTKYYICLFSVSDGKTYTSDLVEFTTDFTIAFDTGSVQDVTENSARISSWFSNPKEKMITEIGFQIGTDKKNMTKQSVKQNVNWTRAYALLLRISTNQKGVKL